MPYTLRPLPRFTQIFLRIVAKLRELGYGPEFDKMSSRDREQFGNLREVAQFRPLTDRSEFYLLLSRTAILSALPYSLVKYQGRMRRVHGRGTGRTQGRRKSGCSRGSGLGWVGCDRL